MEICSKKCRAHELGIRLLGSYMAVLAVIGGATTGCTAPEFADAGTADASSQDASSQDASSQDASSAPDAGPDGAAIDDAAAGDDAASPDAGVDGGMETDCFDGIDNDGDGLIDCADPDCDPIAVCVPAPSDWTGPGVLQVGPRGASPSCEGDYGTTALIRNRDPDAGEADCRECQCDNPTFESCFGTVSASEYESVSCPAGVPTGSTSMRDGPGCYNSGNDLNAYRLRAASFPRGTCDLVQDTLATLTTPTWETVGRFCAPDRLGGGCDADQVCAPRPAAGPAESPVCVAHEGDAACPDGYGRRQILYADFDEHRTCSPCTCTYSGNTGCVGEWEVWSGSACSGSLMASGEIGGSCRSGNPGSYRYLGQRATGEMCAAAGGQPTGCVRGGAPTTICCQPPTDDAPTCPTGPGPLMVEMEDDSGDFYCMDSTEVTNADYQAFLDASPSPASQPDRCLWNESFAPSSGWPADEPDAPVVYVDQCDAMAYCAWAGKRLCGRVGGGSLGETDAVSSLSEWFVACSSRGSSTVPYANAPDALVCPPPSYRGEELHPVRDRPCCSGPEPELYGLMTNAREWVDACTGADGASDTCRVMGARYDDDWDGSGLALRCDVAAESLSRDTTSREIGFRCCAL